MTVSKVLTALLMCIASAFFILGCSSDNTSDKAEIPIDDGKTKIYLITMDKKSPYWQDLDAGCRQAAEEFTDVEYEWTGPVERDAVQQGECVDEAVAAGAKAILISPVSETDINSNLEKANKAGVKIVYVDSAASYDGSVVTLMTDNEAAGKTAGEIMLKALREKGVRGGMIGVLANTPIAFNTELRLKGFREVFAETNYVLAPDFYANSNRQATAYNLKGHPNYVGFFGADQTSTIFIGEHAKDAIAGSVIVGFDTAAPTVSLIKDGDMYATIRQNVKTMGHDGFVAAVKAVNGEYDGKGATIDTGVTVITKDNVSQVES